MNVLKPSLKLSYYIKHPIKFFREIFYGLKYGYNRATKGYSYYDSMDMDNFLLHVIPGMLRDIANGKSYPCDEEFPNYESWQNFCNNLANKFESVQEENCYKNNEYNKQFLTAFDILHNKSPHITMTHTMTNEQAEEICKKFHEREKEIYEERKQVIQEAFNILGKYFFYFWI